MDGNDNPSYITSDGEGDPDGVGSRGPLGRSSAPTSKINGASSTTAIEMSEKRDSAADGKEKKRKSTPVEEVSFRELFRFADGLDILFMVIGTAGATVCGLCMPLLILVLGDMTNSFLNNERKNLLSGQNLLQSFPNVTNAAPLLDILIKETDIIAAMATFSFYYIGIGGAVLVSGYVMIAFWVWASARQTHRIRLAFFRAILRQDVGWYDTSNPGELTTRLAADLSKIQSGIGDKIALLISGLVTFVSGFAIGFAKGWELALVILAFTPLLAFCASLLVKFTTTFSSKEAAAYAKAGSVAEEALSAIRTVVILGAEERTVDKYVQNLDEAKKVGIKKGIVFGVCMGLTWLVIYCAYCVAFWYGAKLVRDSISSGQVPPRYDGGTVLTVFFSVLIGAVALGNATPSLNDLATARAAAYFLYKVIERVPPVDTLSTTGKKSMDGSGEIVFENVGFAYPARPDVKVLRRFNLTVKRGQTVAVVGPSGCGKSTVIQLLQRFYDSDEGSLFVDGANVKNWNVNHLRENIGVVSQEPVLFGRSIAENIRLGREGVSRAQIESAARLANAHDFIMKFPSQYDTIVGQRGSQMSGGQKQRIAIARAVVRDPRILLLDEATSALDAVSEKVVQDAIDEARQGRTTIIVAHRLSTIRGADKIIVIEDGEVVEEGTHYDLIEKEGFYHRLVINQTAQEAERRASLIGAAPDVAADDLIRERASVASAGSVDIADYATAEKEAEKVSLLRIFKLNAPEWPYIVIGCLASVITGASQPAFAILFSEMIRVFIQVDLVKQATDALTISTCFIAIGVGTFLGWVIQYSAFSVSGERLTLRIRKRCLESMLRQEIGWFDRPANASGILTTRLSSDASAIQGAAGIRLAILLQAVTLLLSGIIIAFIYNWKLTLVVLAFIPLIAVGGFVQNRIVFGQAGTNQKHLEKAGELASEAIDNFRTVTMLGLHGKFYDEHQASLQVPLRNEVIKAHTYGITYSFSQSVMYFAYAAAFTLVAHLINNGETDFPDAFRVFFALLFCGIGLGNISSWAPDGAKAQLAAGRIFAILDRRPEIDSSSPPGKMPEQVVGDIAFGDVRFAFPTRPSAKVLRGLNLQVAAGQTLALVGSSGCGKTTMMSLMERLYDPLEGTITLDGLPLDAYNVKWLRSRMGFVQQEPVMFSGTVMENIAYGCSKPVTLDAVISSARDANIHDFIMGLPLRYDTHLGERGSQMSGGQKQRIGIARALIRQPKILLLDEATSALDADSEKLVQEALDRARQGRTCIVIAHRLNTIQNADKICVISHGQVAEQGTHQQLMSQRGLYWKAFTTLTRTP